MLSIHAMPETFGSVTKEGGVVVVVVCVSAGWGGGGGGLYAFSYFVK